MSLKELERLEQELTELKDGLGQQRHPKVRQFIIWRVQQILEKIASQLDREEMNR